MSANRLYYSLKPYLPWRFRMALRRTIARWKREVYQDVWPVNEAAAQPPRGWPGWPDGKKFAFVITHDVEGPEGLAKCQQLMQLEKELGFRSSFNFIPEGDYAVSRELRGELAQNGFEVGVHDLHHDGRLYQSHEDFSQSAKWINHYLKEWDASGFRSGFMLRHLGWLHELEIQYDASTLTPTPSNRSRTARAPFFPSGFKDRKNKRRTVEMGTSLRHRQMVTLSCPTRCRRTRLFFWSCASGRRKSGCKNWIGSPGMAEWRWSMSIPRYSVSPVIHPRHGLFLRSSMLNY